MLILLASWIVVASVGTFLNAGQATKVMVTNVQKIVALNSGGGMPVRWTPATRTPGSSAWIGQVKKIELHAEPTDLVIYVLRGQALASFGSLRQSVWDQAISSPSPGVWPTASSGPVRSSSSSCMR